jgi:hypothetical protein
MTQKDQRARNIRKEELEYMVPIQRNVGTLRHDISMGFDYSHGKSDEGMTNEYKIIKRIRIRPHTQDNPRQNY